MTPEQIERLKSLTEWIGLSSDSQNAIRALLAEWEERGSALDRAAIARGEAEAEIERLRERVSWFERGGGVDKTTAFFREQIRAEQAEARLAEHLAAHRTADAHDCAEMEEECARLKSRLAKVVEILRWLRNEAHAMLSLEREGIIELVAITNVKALEARIAEADAALATAQPEELGPFDSKAQRDRYIGRMMNAQPEEE